MTRRAFWTILIIGAVLRLLLIWQAELWYDENFTLILSRLPFVQMLQATAGDVHPPLYYILVWPLGQISQLPPWALRIPSALFSICSLALLPRLMRALNVPPRVQLVAFIFMALMPMQLHYAQEARMYALLELLVLLGAIAIVEGRAQLLFVSVAGMLYTQNYGTFYVATLGAVLVVVIWQQADRHSQAMIELRENTFHLTRNWTATASFIDPIDDDLLQDLRSKWRRLGTAFALGIAAWIPWLPVMIRQAAFIQDNYWIFDTSPGGIAYEIYKLFWGLSLSTAAGQTTSILLTSGLLIAAVWYLLTRRPHAWLVISALAFGPILIAVVVSAVAYPLLLYRPLIGVTPFLYVAAAYPLAAIPSLRGRLYAACFVVPVLVMGVLGFYRFNPEQKTTQGTGSMQAAVEYVTRNWQPGDVILHGSGLGWVSMQPYTDLPQYAIPNCTPKFPGSISPTTRAAIGIPDGDIDQLPPHKRIWFTAVFSPMLPGCQAAHTESIIAGHQPVLVLSSNKFLLSAIWLLEE